MKRTNLVLMILLTMLFALPVYTRAASVEFQLLTHIDNTGWLPQQKEQSGDHLIQTADDNSGSTYNPDGCFSFKFMNPAGILEPGYAEGIHSMDGSLILDIDIQNGGSFSINSLAFNGYVAPSKPTAHQRLINVGDPAADGSHGPVDGIPNNGSYAASAMLNWAFEAGFDWYYDTPFAGSGTIDITFNNYQWSGFLIPVSELTTNGMATVTLDDSLSYFGGTSADFESWLLDEVTPRLPQEAVYLLFVQGAAHPDWTNPMMGMTTDGIVGETIIGYMVPEPTTTMLLTVGLCCLLSQRREAS